MYHVIQTDPFTYEVMTEDQYEDYRASYGVSESIDERSLFESEIKVDAQDKADELNSSKDFMF